MRACACVHHQKKVHLSKPCFVGDHSRDEYGWMTRHKKKEWWEGKGWKGGWKGRGEKGEGITSVPLPNVFPASDVARVPNYSAMHLPQSAPV